MVQSTDITQPVYALIPAAGSGSRMNLAQNKQFLQVGKYPVIVRTLRVFENHPSITGYLVIAASEDLNTMNCLVQEYHLTKCLGVAVGGASRQKSVALGLESLSSKISDIDNSIILVHDGARCFVMPAVIDRVIEGILLHLACGAAIPVKDTIKRATTSGLVLETLDRSQLWAIQTPQGARFPMLRVAYEQALESGWEVTDDLAVLERAGVMVRLVAGDERNIKLTTQEDLLLGERLAEIYDSEE